MIELYVTISFIYAYIIMSNLENLRHTPTKTDLKTRNKVSKKIKSLESDLNLFLVWPLLLILKFKNEIEFRRSNK